MRDLRSRLHDVVDVGDATLGMPTRGATASDDVLVGVLTARVRRRRGLRGAAAGALTMLTVAAVAAGGVALAGRDGAGPAPATDLPDWRPPACGATVDVTPEPGDIWLGGELRSPTVGVGDPIDVRVVLRDQLGHPVVRLHGAFAHVLVLSDGVVVAHGQGPEDGRGSDSSEGSASHTFAGPVDLVACDGGELPAGDYQVVVAQAWADADGGSARYELTAGPWPFTLIADDDEIRMPAEALVCGEPLPAELPTHPDLGVAVDVDATVPSGERLPWAVRWWSQGAEAPELLVADVELATVRDGVVVGSARLSATYHREEPTLPTDEASALELTGATEATRCGVLTPLPPGEYETVVVLTLVTTDRDVLRAAAPPQQLTITEARPRRLACGDVAPLRGVIAPPDAPVYVNGAVQPGVVRGLVVPVAALVASTADVDLAWPHAVADLAVTRDGVVVATATADLLPDAVPAGMAMPGPVLDVTLVPCDGESLPAGRYDMWLHAAFDIPGVGPVEIVEGDWPFTVEEG